MVPLGVQGSAAVFRQLESGLREQWAEEGSAAIRASTGN
jgi:hypothetical protein